MKKEIKCLFSLLLLIIGMNIFAAETAIDLPPEKVPGVVISHYPGPSGPYVGSPSIAILSDGSYVASHDLFGAGSTFNESGQTKVFRSEDRGKSWTKVADLKESFWSSLFTHKGDLYLIGTHRRFGDVVIRRSTDGGVSWTDPKDGSCGRLSKGAQYHCAPMPVIEHNGRLWRAMEQCNPNKGWGVKFRAGMISASADADLLKRESWTFSNFLASDTAWVNGTFGGWLEGNAVVTPDGEVVDMLRVETKGYPEKTAVVKISADGKLAWFAPLSGFIDMPGGAKKFTIRFDPKSGLYWTLINDVLENHNRHHPGGVRNLLALACSEDLVKWNVRCNLLYHPDVAKIGFQYVDWQFDGEDMIFASRTAYADDAGGPRNMHDANYLTFHRVKNFRVLTMDDSVPFYSMPPIKFETAALSIVGSGWKMAEFKEGGAAFTNRKYAWLEVPPEFHKGWQYTRKAGGEFTEIIIEAKTETKVRIFTAVKSHKNELSGWQAVDGLMFRYNDGGKTRMQVYERHLKKGEKLELPQASWAGTMVLLPRK